MRMRNGKNDTPTEHTNCRKTMSSLFELPSISEVAKKLLEKKGHRQISILLIGKLATGRSALINSLIGDEVAPESDSIKSVTTTIQSYVANVHGIAVKVWDTPGITAGAEDELEKFHALEKAVSEADSIIYCLKMDDLRIQRQDVTTIDCLTQAFGTKFWKGAVFALTFANKVLPPRNYNDPQARLAFFRVRWSKWSEELKETLQKAGVPANVIKSVSFVPAGHYNDPTLPDGCEDWINQFWLMCLSSIMHQATPVVLKVHAENLKPYTPIQMDTYQPSPQPPPQQNLWKIIGILACIVFGGMLGYYGMRWYYGYGRSGLVAGGVLGAVVGFIIAEQYDSQAH